jgi:L-threonylcarbamoyladenylate synthase
MAWKNETDLCEQLATRGIAPDRVMILAHSQVPLGGVFPHVWFIPEDAEAYARALYELLHRCDEAKPDLIVVEALPTTPEWSGIADRLRRAAA